MMRAEDDIPGWLRWAIHEEAGRYEPDRAYMHARVRAAMPSGGLPGRLRLAGVALAASVAVAATTTAVWQGLAGRGPAPAEPITGGSAPALSAPRVSQSSSGAASPMATAGSPMPITKETASVAPPSGTGRFLSCVGALGPAGNRYWTQESVTLTTERRLSSLRVTVRVARARGIDPRGVFVTLPQRDVKVSVRERDGVLSYEFVLRKGRTVPRGRWIFAVQYRHAEGRHDSTLDTYSVTATAVGGTDARAHGHF